MVAGVLACGCQSPLDSPTAKAPTPVPTTGLIRYQQPREIDTKLYDAISKGDVARVARCLAAGADPNANRANGDHPLLSLREENTLAIAKLLVAKGADVNYRQPDQGWTPLTNAINRGSIRIELVRFLIAKGADVNVGLRDGMSPLHLAVSHDSPEAVRELLAHGANVSARTLKDPQLISNVENQQSMAAAFEEGFTNSGLTPAFGLAQIWNGQTADALLQAKADLKATDDSGWTILHYAAKYGNAPAVSGLIARGLDVNARSKGGYTPLHIATRTGYGFPSVEIIRSLLDHGADRNLKTQKGFTAADLVRAGFDRWAKQSNMTPQAMKLDSGFKQILEVSNQAIGLLDLAGPKILLTDSPLPKEGRSYPALATGGMCRLEPTVKIENGQTILEAKIHSEKPSDFTIDEIYLNEFEPISTLPIKAKLGPNPITLRVTFPLVAAKYGGVLKIKFHNGEGGMGELSPEGQYDISPGFEFLQGVAVKVFHLLDREMEFKIDSLTFNGKTQPQFTGRVLHIVGETPTPIKGLTIPQGAKAMINYRYRMLPNVHWKVASMPLGIP